jgi:hypothetical protein
MEKSGFDATSQKPVAGTIYGGMIALEKRRRQARQGRSSIDFQVTV